MNPRFLVSDDVSYIISCSRYSIEELEEIRVSVPWLVIIRRDFNIEIACLTIGCYFIFVLISIYLLYF